MSLYGKQKSAHDYDCNVMVYYTSIKLKGEAGMAG